MKDDKCQANSDGDIRPIPRSHYLPLEAQAKASKTQYDVDCISSQY